MRIPGADKAIDNLLKWSSNEQWGPLREQVFAEHLDTVCDRNEADPEQIAELLGDAFGMVFGCMLEDYFTARFGADGEQNVIDDYLRRRGWRENASARRYLEALRDSVLSLYEVVDLDPGRSMTVRDLVLGGDPVTVEEKLGSESAVRWDRLAARVVTVNKKTYFTGSLLLFPHEAADDLLASLDTLVKSIKAEIRREAKKQGNAAKVADRDVREMILHTSARLFIQAWLMDALESATAPPPEVRNSDGDEIVFSEALFPIIGDRTDIVTALDKIDAIERDEPNTLRWTWHGHGSPSRRMSRDKGLSFMTSDEAGRTVLGGIEIAKNMLVLRTNSKERADRGGELLRARLDGLVGPPLTSHQTLERMLEGRPHVQSQQLELPADVAEQTIHSALDGHYRQALDMPTPHLDGKTPRHAAKTKKGKARVTSWLKRLENSERRRAASEGQQPYDFQWMWRELKIDDAR